MRRSWALVMLGASLGAILTVPSSSMVGQPAVTDSPALRSPVELPAAPRGLDGSGRTVPTTSYPMPDEAVVMAPDGFDEAPGTVSAPVRTLNRAVELAANGGTIVLREGEYRDWFSGDFGDRVGVITKDLTFQAYPGESPWISGADLVDASRWTQRGHDEWVLDWATPQFCDGQYYSRRLSAQSVEPNNGPCAHADMSDNPSNPVANDPQMVFVDGAALRQLPYGEPLSPNSFSYDWEERRIVMSVDPRLHQIEVTARPTALLLAGKGKSTIRGIGFRRFGSNQYPGPTRAAVLSSADSLAVENAVFTENAAQGLAISQPWGGAVVRRSVFADNGYTALGANGGSIEGRATPLLVEQNVLRGNNAEGFGERCTVSCGAAAAKFAHIRGLTLTRNLVEDTVGPAAGLWCDLDCSDTTYTYNVVRGHQKSGIFHEVSDTGIIAANVLIDNEYGITVASANTDVYHNTLVNNVQGIYVYDDPRSRGGRDGSDDVGPATRHVRVGNNVVMGLSYSMKLGRLNSDGASSTDADQLLSEMAGNVFYQPTYQPKFVTLHFTDGRDVECRARATDGPCHLDRGGSWLTGQTDPLFVDQTAGDLRIRPRSPAYRGAVNLPAEVADALGVTTDGSRRRRGAFARP